MVFADFKPTGLDPLRKSSDYCLCKCVRFDMGLNGDNYVGRQLDRKRLARSASAVDKIGMVDDLALKQKFGGSNLLVPAHSLAKSTHSPVISNGHSSEAGSRLSSANFYRKRLTEAVVEIPVKQLKSLKQQDISSYARETKHFCETTTMHGPKRVYKGKKWSFIFWFIIFAFSIGAFTWQVWWLYRNYESSSTVSQVTFTMNNEGMEFPVITICPFNTIKKSGFAELNQTGDFSDELLGYLLETNVEAPALYSSSNKLELTKGEKLLEEYRARHPEFKLYPFFKDYGFNCKDIMRWCTFGGRKFECCDYASAVLTTIGKCQRIEIGRSNHTWMKKQISAGSNAGLQLILDSQQDEQFNDNSTVASPLIEHGFRYYIHDSVTVPYLASEGISVSPGMRVYSALSVNKYLLLDKQNDGCINGWPENYNMTLTYTAATCSAKCKALFFNQNCGCSPSAYDVEDIYSVCSPLQVFECINKYMTKDNSTDFDLPRCDECKMECQSTVYQTFNSYGQAFSVPSMRWLSKKNAEWTPEVIKKNFLTINVFFRDLTHTEYKQLEGQHWSEFLSNVGGNMGMFLGMSTITITEITLFLGKMIWILISKSRRIYMAEKKKREEDRDKEVVETVKEFKRIRSCNDLHSINGIRPLDPFDLYMHVSPPPLSLESCNSSLNGGIGRETDSGNATDR